MRLRRYSHFSRFLTVWTCTYHDRACCAALTCDSFGAFECISQVWTFQSVTSAGEVSDGAAASQEKNRPWWWESQQPWGSFQRGYVLLWFSFYFLFPSCCPAFCILLPVAAKYPSLLLCLSCSSSFLDVSVFLHKHFLSLLLNFIKLFLFSTFPPVLQWMSLEVAGQISLLLSLLLVVRTGIALLKGNSGLGQLLVDWSAACVSFVSMSYQLRGRLKQGLRERILGSFRVLENLYHIYVNWPFQSVWYSWMWVTFL